MISKEDMEWLSQFETNFRTAINSSYSRNITSSQANRMKEIYEVSTGRKYSLCVHCSSNVLSFLKVIGKLYLDQKGNEPALTDSKLENKVTKMEKKNGKSTKGQNVGKGKNALHN